ncbi:MAG TPA: CAP domain-containing protein [Microvirga sp.]|jgi:uncharacterized protein YkwD
MIRLALAALPLVLGGCVMEERESPARPGFYQSLAAPNAVVDGPMARDMIGAYRRNKGLGPLVLDPDLQAAAEAEARAMASADKPRSADALKASLAQGGLRDPAANLSAGYHTLPEAFSGWRESPVHDRVLLDPRAARMGIATAYAPGSKYKVYWALVTAGPP